MKAKALDGFILSSIEESLSSVSSMEIYSSILVIESLGDTILLIPHDMFVFYGGKNLGLHL